MASTEQCNNCHYVFEFLSTCPRILSQDVWFNPDEYYLISLFKVVMEMCFITAQFTFHIWVLAYLILFLTRSKYFQYFGYGPIIALILSKQVKKFIEDPRPEDSCRSDFGMPSSHLSFMMAVVVNIGTIVKIQTIKQKDLTVGLLLLVFAFYQNLFISASKYYFSYHTLLQILFGQALGAFSSLLGDLIMMYNT